MLGCPRLSSPPVLTMGLAGASGCHTEPGGAHAVAGHVLLGLEEYDVELGGEEAPKDDGATEAHRDAHGGGLDLETGWVSGVPATSPLPRGGQDEALAVAPASPHWAEAAACTPQACPTPPQLLLSGWTCWRPRAVDGPCTDGGMLLLLQRWCTLSSTHTHPALPTPLTPVTTPTRGCRHPQPQPHTQSPPGLARTWLGTLLGMLKCCRVHPMLLHPWHCLDPQGPGWLWG